MSCFIIHICIFLLSLLLFSPTVQAYFSYISTWVVPTFSCRPSSFYLCFIGIPFPLLTNQPEVWNFTVWLAIELNKCSVALTYSGMSKRRILSPSFKASAVLNNRALFSPLPSPSCHYLLLQESTFCFFSIEEPEKERNQTGIINEAKTLHPLKKNIIWF